MNIFSAFFGPSVPNVDPSTAQAKLGDKNKPVLLDVREPHEFKSGHIPGAMHIPLGQLAHRVSQLPQDREIICVCHSGNRSASAARLLNSSGYKAVNLNGGMIGWARAGLPVKKGNGR